MVELIYLSGCVRPELIGRREDAGLMLQPNMGNRPDLSATWFAIDNGCFAKGGSFDLLGYVEYLKSLRPYRERCLFATGPDVMGSAALTLGRSLDVLPIIRHLGFPAAFVAQYGIEEITVPWDTFDCLFVGGGQFKLEETAFELAAEAKRRGKWVHMGQVNSLARLRTAQVGGYDSADGTFVRFGPDRRLPEMISWLDALQAQPTLL
jgi:hypothetical protein